ncbi:MAG: CusA/CzcA family heavy metal efflux RND transporter [Gammaproteobacteria bacterium]|nr:CusA/CzcA family heavy metal efflux RND transporter [Gammaproteobacteria bacterium]MDE0410616.1 CusA/CzcA family heavy metal efflux RND transporter [Gammaproteobacteria bacterium]
MIEKIIDISIKNRTFVLLFIFFIVGWGIYAVKSIPLDAIPDLSDVQVIIKTSYPGQSPQVVEDQVTYPLSVAMLSVPKAVNVRGYSFFGDSYVYIIFEDKTDLYWARTRVLEYLSQVASSLPAAAKTQLGPDATGVGWIYEYALVDRSGGHDLAQLRSIQDWYLKYELQTVSGVSEVATVGGMVKQYQVVVNPNSLRAHGIPLSRVRQAIVRANQETSGSVIEMAEAEYMVRATGYVDDIQDLYKIPLAVNERGTPILLENVAEIRLGPQLRRGIAELDGEGEVVGGVIVMRFGENALQTIQNVKDKIKELKKGLPESVEIVETYNRAALIERAVDTLNEKLVEEFIVVALVCALFLFHLRSALVIVLSLPVGILAAFIAMQQMGINANIMSLGGIAIAVGAMVDAAVVMIENTHKHLEKEGAEQRNRWEIISESTKEVGPPLFFSLIIITLSFLPVFTLEAQEGRLFSPLAYTKTFAMAAAAALSITLVPVLMGYFIRGRVIPENKNPINRLLIAGYRPLISFILKAPKIVLLVALIVIIAGVWPITRLGSEFMPDLNEGDLLYMPTTYPSVSIGKAQELLQQTDKLIRTVPEVETVFGKMGRADSATDTAPLTMIETVIKLKPENEWREGITIEDLKHEFNQLVQIPGLTNAWVMPIKSRIDMLSTGIRTPVGIKIAGADLSVIQEIGKEIEVILKRVRGTVSAYSERVSSGRYIIIDIDRNAASRYALDVMEIQEVVQTAIGGMQIAMTTEGLERYPINLRYPRDWRDSITRLHNLPVVTPTGAQVALQEVADIRIEDGPALIKTENARLNGWIYVDIENRDLGSYVQDAQKAVEEHITLTPGYSISWSGQYEYLLRAKERLSVVIPLTLVIIVLLLYLNFRRFTEVIIIMSTLPMALVGGILLLYLLDYDMSVAVGVGFIALAGVSVEIGVVMLVYLNQAFKNIQQQAEANHREVTRDDIRSAVISGALLRVRPIMMTVAAIIAGLLPIMLGSGTGSEVMRRIATPMVGGMISVTLLTLLVIPAMFLVINQFKLPKSIDTETAVF